VYLDRFAAGKYCLVSEFSLATSRYKFERTFFTPFRMQHVILRQFEMYLLACTKNVAVRDGMAIEGVNLLATIEPVYHPT
jgi:hypothetical protein